jgi:hypothetical protein
VTTPYRNEIDALRERKGSLEREIAQLKNQTSELEGLRAQQQELERELSGIAQKIGSKRALPMLDSVRVASPCSADWNDMVGDDRVRFCTSCEKNVYNLSAMNRAEAEQLLQERAGGEMCVRFYQRADGTIMTDDCPVGVKRKRRKKLALAVAGAGAMAFAAVSAMTSRQGGCRPMTGAVAMGEMEVVAVKGKPGPALEVQPQVEELGRMSMGGIGAPQKVEPPKPPPPVRMGKRAR